MFSHLFSRSHDPQSTVPEWVDQEAHVQKSYTIKPEVSHTGSLSHRNCHIPEVSHTRSNTHQKFLTPEVSYTVSLSHQKSLIPEVCHTGRLSYRKSLTPEISHTEVSHTRSLIPEVTLTFWAAVQLPDRGAGGASRTLQEVRVQETCKINQ